ncbi:hypothetical protein NP493_2736g00005 [Ridgeia piscesae]|uniref:ZSWIM1/3 RNaseH-like domain-containing protein n=1 Tax=Ridgeia piscesae TaxID=27915 RepID=A0AAD9JD37_RIDPI|nr:hypothetical protein NP493_2736g00005 [Ridgeia piscesae]
MHEPVAVRFSRRIVGLQTAVLRVSLKSYYRFETGIPHELCRIAHARGDAQGQSGGSSQDVCKAQTTSCWAQVMGRLWLCQWMMHETAISWKLPVSLKLTTMRSHRLTTEDKAIAVDMLKLKSSKKLLQVFIHEQTGKVVTLRDVSNIQTNMRCHDGNDLTKVVTRLRAMEEVVMADATYKLTDLRMPLFLMIGIDGDGHSQVVAVYLTCTETAAALTHMLEPRTEVIVTDKDMCERSVFSVAFPEATLQLCLFYTLLSFSREVTLDKMGVPVGQRDALLHIFNAMAIARCEQEFEEQCALLEEMAIPTALTYFRRNWLPVKHEWEKCFKVRHFMLGEH